MTTFKYNVYILQTAILQEYDVKVFCLISGLLLVLPVEVAPLSTEVLYASDGVLHELRAKGDQFRNVPITNTVGRIYSNFNLLLTLQWTSTLMVSRLRFVLRTLMYSIKGRMLMPCGTDEGERSETLQHGNNNLTRMSIIHRERFNLSVSLL